jgi:hypothetical protein
MKNDRLAAMLAHAWDEGRRSPAGTSNPYRIDDSESPMKLCPKCIVLKDQSEFKTNSSQPTGKNSVCRQCSYEAEKANGYTAKRSRKRKDLLRRETIDGATHRYQPWTGPQLELAMRYDLTAKEIALMTGRTHSAVQSMRARLRREDPTTLVLAGEKDFA